MEESWINLNLQHNRSRPIASQEDDAEEVISAPSTDSSTNSSSLDSLQSPEDQISRSGITDENLRASLGTLLDRNQQATQQDITESAASDKQRRDTITPADKPKIISPDRERESMRTSKQERREREEERRLSYWEGFYTGITLGLSTALCGLALWRVCVRLHLFR